MRIFILLLLMACTPQGDVHTNPIAEINEIMHWQEKAWNEGDLEGFMEAYMKNDSLVFIGSKGLTYGWKQTLINYKSTYSSPEKMGQLKFHNKKFIALNDSNIWCAGEWTLFRNTDTLSGHYTLLWKHFDGEWKIIADHSS